MRRTAWATALAAAATLVAALPVQARGFAGGAHFGGGGRFGGGGGGFGGRLGGGGGFGGDLRGGSALGGGGDFRSFGGGNVAAGGVSGGRVDAGRITTPGGTTVGGVSAGGFRAGGVDAGSFSGSNFRAAGFGNYTHPVPLPTDGGWGNHVNVGNRVNVNSNHITQHWGNTYINNGTINVRNNWNSWGRWHGAGRWYGPGWYASYPGAWAAAGWAAATAWTATSYAALAGLWSGGGSPPPPVNYDYGNTIVYQGDQVYVSGQPTATAQQYYQQAQQLAATGQNQPPANSDWKPLGVFGLVQPNDTSATQLFQMAVNGQGIIGGNYTNVLTNTVLPIKGSVNTQTQRAAWTIGTNTSTVYEAGVYNLTQGSAPCLVHVGADSTQQWLLVRLPAPSQDGSNSGGTGGQ